MSRKIHEDKHELQKEARFQAIDDLCFYTHRHLELYVSPWAMNEICEQLLMEVERSYSENKKLSDDLLSSLSFVFQGPLLLALELVEKSAVTKLFSPSGRSLFQVIGDSGTPYICFPNLKYCSCPAYNFKVLHKEDYVMCKHVLAVRMSEAMKSSKNMEVSDEEIANMIIALD